MNGPYEFAGVGEYEPNTEWTGEYVESGYGESGYGESGYGESGYGESGYGEFGYGESGYGESGYGESGYGESGYGESGYGEARRRPRPARPVRTAPRQSAYRARPTGTAAPVTQAQLQAALARVSQQIGVNSNAVRTLDGRVRGAVAEQGRMGAALRKMTADRRRETDGLRRELQSSRELSALIPLVAPPGTPFGNIAPLAHLLPSETWGGAATAASGSSPGGTGSSLFGGSNVIALIAIAAAAGGLGFTPTPIP